LPAFIHDRAKRIMKSTVPEYGKEKGKQVAFALATQEAHAMGKSPKTWKGEPFGTAQGRREAKAKFPHPSKMKKTAEDPVTGLPTADEIAEHVRVGMMEAGKPLDNGVLKTNALAAVTPIMASIDAYLKKADGEPSEDQVAEFLQRNPNPSDDAFHQWAEGHGWEPDDAEAVAYRLATQKAQFNLGGKANEAGKTPADVDQDQLAKGLIVEKEHTPNLQDRARISTDHIVEDGKYYDDPMFKSDLKKTGTISFENGKFVLHTKGGGRVLGKHPDRASAVRQERAVHVNKHAAIDVEVLIPHVLEALGG
jgi:hypothetical protein